MLQKATTSRNISKNYDANLFLDKVYFQTNKFHFAYWLEYKRIKYSTNSFFDIALFTNQTQWKFDSLLQIWFVYIQIVKKELVEYFIRPTWSNNSALFSQNLEFCKFKFDT